MTNLPRRTVLAGALATPALMTRAAEAAAPLKVGFVYVAPIGKAGWTYQHELGRLALQAKLGDKVKTSYVANVNVCS